MGWFEEQVKKRKTLDGQKFEESFMSLAGIRNDKQKDLSDDAIRENFVIKQILSYYRRQMVDIPSNIDNFNDKLTYALSQFDIEYHKVELNDAYEGDPNSPLLIFTFTGIPVMLFPGGKGRYTYINYSTGKKSKIDASLVNRLEIEALAFYRPLPSKKVSIKEYFKYISKSIKPIDIILLVLFAAAVSGVGMLLPYFTKMLTGDVTQTKDMSKFVLVSIYVVSAATGLIFMKAIQAFVNARISIIIEKAVIGATMSKVLNLPPSFFKQYNTGELSSRFNSVPRLAGLLLNGIFVTSISVIMSLAYLGQLAGFAPVLIPPVILILLVSSTFSIIISVVQKNHQQKLLEFGSKESGVTYQVINGIQKIRLSGSEKRIFAKWANVYAKSAKVVYNPPLIMKLAPAVHLLITLLGNIVLYYLSVKYNVDVGNYMAFTTIYGVLSAAFSSVVEMVGVVFTIQPVYEMARPILESEVENSQGKQVLKSISGNIKVENVSFRYNEASPLIVDNLSLDIKEGEYIAIVGQTGCGKSTLVRLLLGFEKPLSGKILYDNKNLENIDVSSLRRNIGTVMQNGTLFHADIFSNIIISCPSLKEEDAWAAAEIANIADDIREMPMGMKTVISEGQGGISGGQKQRIMIARAIVHKPKILIFDEATSALDNKTQKSISESINKLNCTRIVIAHRLSTIKNADRIIMLEGGKIIEDGSYKELIAKKGKFAELVERQRLDNK